MRSDGNSNQSRGERYETTLGYLKYEEASDKISLPIQIRERHLTQDTKEAKLQAVGPDLRIAVRSKRDDITIDIPMREWYTSRAYAGTFTGANAGLLSVGRWERNLEPTPNAGNQAWRINARIEAVNQR